MQSIFMILYWIKLNTSSTLRLVSKQSRSGDIWVCFSYAVNSNAHTTPVRIYGEPYVHKFCAVDIFWNITRRQAISPVAKFHHVLGRGFIIQRVILIFIKRLSANHCLLVHSLKTRANSTRVVTVHEKEMNIFNLPENKNRKNWY